MAAEAPAKTRGKAATRARVQLLRDRRIIEQEIAIAGCDPAIFLAGEYLRRYKETATVTGWTMGSSAALEALKRREVHVAGLHIVDRTTGESNLPYLRQYLKGDNYLIVTFAAWEEGLIVRQGNPNAFAGSKTCPGKTSRSSIGKRAPGRGICWTSGSKRKGCTIGTCAATTGSRSRIFKSLA